MVRLEELVPVGRWCLETRNRAADCGMWNITFSWALECSLSEVIAALSSERTGFGSS